MFLMERTKEIENKILSEILGKENSDADISAEVLEKKLDSELSGYDDEIDFSLVDQLALSVIEARGNNVPEIDTDQKLKEFNKVHLPNRRKKIRFTGFATIASVLCLLVIGNIYTVKAWNMNLFTFAVEYTKDGVLINFDRKNNEITLPASENDPYGIIAKCSEAGIDAEIPFYIPEGFYLKECNKEVTDDYKYVMFYFAKDDAFINFTYDSYLNDESVGIPSDKHNVTETTVNGHTTAVSKEDNQMIAVFKSGEYLFTLFTQNVDYQECDKILENIRNV